MKKLLTTIAGVVICLSLSGCGSTGDRGSEHYAQLESRIAELEAELRNSKDTSNLGTEVSPIAEKPKTEQGIVMLTPVSPSPTPAPEPDNDYDRLYYSSTEELVKMYRSGEWDGNDECFHRGDDRIASLSYTGEINEYERGDRYEDFKEYPPTNLYPDLPDGHIPTDYIDYLRYHWQDSWSLGGFECLEADGVHIYEKGEEKAFYPVDGITEESTFAYLFRVGECIYTGSQIINYQADGGYSIVLDNVVDLREYDGGSKEIIMFHDNEIQYFGNWRHEDRGDQSYTITKTATAVACTEWGLNVVFTDADGYTYIVNLDDRDTALAIEAGNTDVLYQYRLGQEAPEYYVAAYEDLTDEYIASWGDSSRGTVSDPFEALISKYCE